MPLRLPALGAKGAGDVQTPARVIEIPSSFVRGEHESKTGQEMAGRSFHLASASLVGFPNRGL